MSVLRGQTGIPDRATYHPTHLSQTAVLHGDKSWSENQNKYPTGLPTPPASKTIMPALVLGNNYTNFSDPAFSQSKSIERDGHQNQSQRRSSSSSINDAHFSGVVPANVFGPTNDRMVSQNNVHSIAPHLQIPESVNKSKGSLAEFAAEITCLFWFETAETLQYAQDLPSEKPVDRALLPDAIPSIGFRKWVTTIISTTQVGKNVILLALMFIYRLKRFNPTVSGKRGSEFRLLTVALMLGNKFLDDNTYTNKTWAEVSGIPVNEIHIMEVEFLSNMRYDLYASAEKWRQWKDKLGRFGDFYNKASQLAILDENRSTPAPVTPTSQSFPHKLPSPPSTHHHLSPFSGSSSRNNTNLNPTNYPSLPHPFSSIPPLPNSPLRQQLVSNPTQPDRKRSFDYSSDLPPAKRHHSTNSTSLQPTTTQNQYGYTANGFQSSPGPAAGSTSDYTTYPPIADLPRLDLPRLTAVNSINSQQLAPLSVPSSRAMSTVYPITTSGYSQPVTPISAIPQNLFQNPIPNLGEGSRQLPAYSSTNTSPLSAYNTTTPTLPGLSPSYFLGNRASPYRPVRHVNTLLIPPPSGALQTPVRHVSAEQIHYQPLSKVNTERRTGLLPMMQPESWLSSSLSTPITGQRPY